MTKRLSIPPTEPETNGGVPTDLSGRELRRVFAEPVRRATLAVLVDATTPTSLETLATELECRSSELALDASRATLHHQHLPILDDAGLVEYEPATNTIESCHGAIEPLVD